MQKAEKQFEPKSQWSNLQSDHNFWFKVRECNSQRASSLVTYLFNNSFLLWGLGRQPPGSDDGPSQFSLHITHWAHKSQCNYSVSIPLSWFAEFSLALGYAWNVLPCILLANSYSSSKIQLICYLSCEHISASSRKNNWLLSLSHFCAILITFLSLHIFHVSISSIR